MKDDGVEVPVVVLLCVAVFMFGIILGASCDLSVRVSSRPVPTNPTAVELETGRDGDAGNEPASPPSTAASG